MSKYKVGDMVRVKDDLVILKSYSMEENEYGEVLSDVFVEEMEAYKGKEFVIVRMSCGKYELDGIIEFLFTDEMLESVKNKDKEQMKENPFKNDNAKKWEEHCELMKDLIMLSKYGFTYMYGIKNGEEVFAIYTENNMYTFKDIDGLIGCVKDLKGLIK